MNMHIRINDQGRNQPTLFHMIFFVAWFCTALLINYATLWHVEAWKHVMCTALAGVTTPSCIQGCTHTGYFYVGQTVAKIESSVYLHFCHYNSWSVRKFRPINCILWRNEQLRLDFQPTDHYMYFRSTSVCQILHSSTNQCWSIIAKIQKYKVTRPKIKPWNLAVMLQVT